MCGAGLLPSARRTLKARHSSSQGFRDAGRSAAAQPLPGRSQQQHPHTGCDHQARLQTSPNVPRGAEPWLRITVVGGVGAGANSHPPGAAVHSPSSQTLETRRDLESGIVWVLEKSIGDVPVSSGAASRHPGHHRSHGTMSDYLH